MIPPDVATRLAAEAHLRSGIMGALDRHAQRALDGPGRLERLILTAVGSGIGLLWLGWVLARR